MALVGVGGSDFVAQVRKWNAKMAQMTGFSADEASGTDRNPSKEALPWPRRDSEIVRFEVSRASGPWAWAKVRFGRLVLWRSCFAASLHTTILDFRGFDSNRILISRCGILMSTGNSVEILSQGILVGIVLVGRLGV